MLFYLSAHHCEGEDDSGRNPVLIAIKEITLEAGDVLPVWLL